MAENSAVQPSLLKSIMRKILPTGDMFNDSLVAATGGGYDALRQRSKVEYPNVPSGSQHHQLAARLATEALLNKIGGFPGGIAVSQALPQIAGGGVELSEALGRILGGVPGASIPEHFTMKDTREDFKANLRGGAEATDNYINKKRRGMKDLTTPEFNPGF